MDLKQIQQEQLIERYVAGNLSAETKEAFELFMLDHPQVLEEVRLETLMRDALQGPARDALDEVPSAPHRRAYAPPLALAATLIIGIALGWVMKAPTPPAGEAVQMVRVGLTRNDDEIRVSVPPSPHQTMVLSIHVTDIPMPEVQYAVRLSGHNVLIEQDIAANGSGDLVFQINRAHLEGLKEVHLSVRGPTEDPIALDALLVLTQGP